MDKSIANQRQLRVKVNRAETEWDSASVTLNSEMDFYLRNGDFFTKWSYKIQFYSLSGTIFCVNIKVRHAYHLIVLFQVF